ncbi:MAG: hypothetical protein WD801_03470 [Gemmatimonadaceae bacterium]
MKRIAMAGSLALLLGCSDSQPLSTIDVSLAPGQLFEHRTVGGDEEGARLVVQARHFTVSEIRRNAQTGWVAVYTYQPAEGYIGFDSAEIEVLTGSEGTSAPTHTTRILFRFNVNSR